MKKLSVAVIVMMFAASAVFAANFAPTALTITGPNSVNYDFEGAEVTIPVTITGTPANVVFSVFTNDKGSTVNKVRNGYLGWHFVNKIDTCVYVAPAKSMEKGEGTIVWNGKDEAGTVVAPGTYTYYLWGYDHISPKQVVTRKISFGWNEQSIIVKKDEKGNPLVNPVIYKGGGAAGLPTTATARTHQKWVIGGDPDDGNLVETTQVAAGLYADNASISLLPTDHSMWFKCIEKDGGQCSIGKYKWVPNGVSQLQTDWGDQGFFKWQLPEHKKEFHNAATIIDGGSHIFTLNADLYSTSGGTSELIYVDYTDGAETARVDLSDWWVNLEDGKSGGQSVGGPSDVIDAGHGKIYLQMHGSCIQQVIDPYRNDSVGGDINDLTLWVNGNGDYVADHNFESTATRKWICNDYNVGPYMYNAAIDDNGWSTFTTYDLGSVSFGLIAPDGTGIGNFAFAGETAKQKYGNYVIDYDSPFDGFYVGNTSADTDTGGWWFVGQDSFKGVITSQVGVADAPSAFAVAQNVPNPFNPSTTISFTLAKAGKTTVEVFNAAGQKVDTVLNANLGAGNHSATWNAARFSAGVYFYTVKSGDFSKTMKMTLLK